MAKINLLPWRERRRAQQRKEFLVVLGSMAAAGALATVLSSLVVSGQIPRDPELLRRVVGGFNGGFQAMHGEFGMMAEGRVYLPPKPWAATVGVYADGRVALGSWQGPPKRSWVELDLALIKREPMGGEQGVRVWREQLVWVGAGEDVLPPGAPVPLVAAPAPCV